MKQSRYLIIGILMTGVMHLASAGTITGKVKARGVKNSADAVVYIDKIPSKTFPAPKDHALMDQKNLTFTPHVLPIVAGTTVDFLNSDDVLHNVFSPDQCTNKFNLGSWPKGQKKSFTFKEPGPTVVLMAGLQGSGKTTTCGKPNVALVANTAPVDLRNARRVVGFMGCGESLGMART